MERTSIPYLHDHHNHPCLYSVLSGALDLGGADGPDDALAMIDRECGRKPKSRGGSAYGTAVLACGWNDSRVALRTEDLEELPPVFVCGESLHSHLMNSAARELFRPAWKPVVEGIDDPRWIERNLPSILAFMMEAWPAGEDGLLAFFGRLESAGVRYAEDMLVPGAGHVRTVRSAGLFGRTALWTDPATFAHMDEEARSEIAGLKVWADGALGARTAALSEPYAGGGEGLLVYEDGELSGIVREAARLGMALSIHTLGDLAVEQALSVLEEWEGWRGRVPAVRLEHCQFITGAQAARAARLDLVLSMQPNFSIDSATYTDRISPEACERNNPFRMLIDEAGFRPGADLIFGSDGMPHGLPVALEASLFPPFASQRLSLEEFRAGYCMGGGPSLDVVVDEESRRVSFSGA